MSLINSDGLSLFVGNGASPTEIFSVLRGTVISRFEMSQQISDSNTISGDAWLVGVGTTERRAVIECDVLATDEPPAERLRSLAMSGAASNVRLGLKTSEKVQFSAYVTRYREVLQSGEIKRLLIRLESSGAVSLV